LLSPFPPFSPVKNYSAAFLANSQQLTANRSSAGQKFQLGILFQSATEKLFEKRSQPSARNGRGLRVENENNRALTLVLALNVRAPELTCYG
jgi:hypothetical protein